MMRPLSDEELENLEDQFAIEGDQASEETMAGTSFNNPIGWHEAGVWRSLIDGGMQKRRFPFSD